MDAPGNGWREWEHLVLKELERLNNWAERLDKAIDEIHRTDLANIRSDIRLLQFRAGMWGGLAGVGAALAAALVHYATLVTR